MRLIFGLVLLMGIGLAGFAAYMAQQYIGQTQAELAEARAAAQGVVETVEVYTARRPLRYGEPLTRDDVVAIDWPAYGAPPSAFTDIDDLFPENAPGPRHIVRAMEPGEPLLPAKITRPGQDAGITSQLSPGMRAFTIQVNVTTGVSGFLRPADRVDIYWTGRSQNGEVTKLIETGIRLIAVDQSADQDRENRAVIARNVTVEATPQQVAALAQAQTTGRLSLALVGVSDEGAAAEVAEMNQRSLLGIQVEEPVEAAPEPERCTIRTRRGGEVVEIPVACN
jgi:pilus assembly protein CpaB